MAIHEFKPDKEQVDLCKFLRDLADKIEQNGIDPKSLSAQYTLEVLENSPMLDFENKCWSRIKPGSERILRLSWRYLEKEEKNTDEE